MQTHETHVCFVLNEYGGFEGLITMHDIMESIVGGLENRIDCIPTCFSIKAPLPRYFKK